MSSWEHNRLSRALDWLLGRRKARNAAHSRALAQARQANADWLMSPDLLGIGVGRRASGGLASNELALCVQVREKRPQAFGNTGWIPPSIRVPGIPGVVALDVQASTPVSTQDARCGDAISEQAWPDWGTMGCLVEADGGLRGKLMVLTCSHVLPGAVGSSVEWLGFPGRDDAARLQLGTLVARSTLLAAAAGDPFPNLYEVSLAEVTQLTVDDDLQDLGPPTALRVQPVVTGDHVRLWGARSGLCEGRVTDTGQSRLVDIDGVSFGFQNLVLYDAPTDFGDSGAAVVDADNQVVGLHIGSVDGKAVMTPIGPIVRRYGLRLPSFPSGRPMAKRGLVPVGERAMAIDTLARTLWGEARGEPDIGKEAVANVVVNRARRRRRQFGLTVEAVCRKPWQFSCWNTNDPNRQKIEQLGMASPWFAQCLDIARRAVSGELDDHTSDSTHYHSRSVSPKWARGRVPVTEIGSHLFYNDVP